MNLRDTPAARATSEFKADGTNTESLWGVLFEVPSLQRFGNVSKSEHWRVVCTPKSENYH
jgi:hypothetical protein